MCAMYKDLSKANSKIKKDDKIESYEVAEFSSDYLDIWDVNPSYKDINSRFSIIKGISLTIILFFLAISTYLLTTNLYISIGLTIFTLLFFIFAFSDNFFNLKNLYYYLFHKFISINPFENLSFCTIKEEPTFLLIFNKKDAISTAMRIFKIETLPENVYPTLNQFLKALNKAQISYTYQVVQSPYLDFSEPSSENRFQVESIRSQNLSSIDSFHTSIYFCVYYNINGILSSNKIDKLIEIVTDLSNEFKSNFSANFHHTKISLLDGIDLINAIRAFFCKSSIQPVDKEDLFIAKRNLPKVLFKTGFVSFLIIYLSYLLLSLIFPLGFIILINFLLELLIICIWWREILFYFLKSRLSRNLELTQINPFTDVEFYRLKKYNDLIFTYINNQLLLASKIFNLKFAAQPTLTYFDKFIRGIDKYKIIFNYNLQVTPISANLFSKECLKLLNDKTKESLEGILYITLDKTSSKKVKHPEIEFEKWLDMRSGVWKTMLTVSTSSYLFTKDLTFKNFIELDKELSTNAKILKRTFEDNFLNFKLVGLKNQLLISGFLSECLKNHSFRLNGTHLNYVYFQGKSLIELAKIVNEFKKGIDTRIAAEFNTPLQLNNFITIGNTINTEFLDEEVPFGLTFDQLRQLLITNGLSYNREHAKMKIVSELVKANKSCLVFDYSGKCSKLINFFKDSQYNRNILYFKLGSSFSIDLKHSGMKYDKNNIDYLNLFFDTFALAFKAEKRYVDLLKDSFLKQDELDVSSISLDLEMKNKWERDYKTNNLIAIFRDFRSQSQIFSNLTLDHEDEINPIDFLRNDKSIIVDLSILKDLEQKTFVTFIIISKLIHYLQNSTDYYKKVIFIPNIDMFFDSFFIDNNYNTTNYGKVSKFLEPFLECGFGLICSANQIRYLHPNVFSFLHNIITFRATDTRDIAVLKNQMNLQELQGTGYYSSKRNNTYQINYLMNMRENEVIIKRTDIYQPFPGVIELTELKGIQPLQYEKILIYMEKQGYKLKLAERRITEKAKKTLFEKDLGLYIDFIDEIINFLNAVKTVDKVGGLYRQKLKSELSKFIASKASKKVKNKKQISELRDDLFHILVKHGYLVEAHPHKAGGSESIRTCYKVGTKYDEALNDYFQTKGDYLTNASVEVIERNSDSDSNILDYFRKETKKDIINHEKFNEILLEQCSKLLWKSYKIFSANNKNEYGKSLKIGENFIKDFLINLHQSYLQENDISIPEINDPEIFFDHLAKNNLIPLTKDELRDYFKKYKEIISNTSNIEKTVKNLHDLLFEFYTKFQSYIS